MEKAKKALDLFTNGYSCSQSVLMAFANEVGIDEDAAFRIGAGLGGGIGRTQNICGTINAGAIILGIKHGNYNPDDIDSKNRVSEFVGKFVTECKQVLGETQCLNLLKIDITNEQLKQFAKDSGHLERVCNNAVLQTANVLQKYLTLEPVKQNG